MKWILCGKNDVGAEALEFLVERGDEVWAIATRDDSGEDGWQRSLRKVAAELGVECSAPPRINAPEIVDQLAAYAADGLLSLQYDQILRGPLFRAVGCPCLNFHFALLPRHRGVSPIAFAVLEGDAEAGVTLHEMVEDIDAGDVLDQRAVAIEATSSAREVYDAVSQAAVSLFRDRYPFGPELTRQRIVQDPAEASYHRKGDFDFAARTIDWQRDAGELQRWLRAVIFPPFQLPETRFGDRILRVEAVRGEVGPAVAAPPGAVVAFDGDAVEVAAGGGTVGIARFAEDTAWTAARESLAVGARLGNPPEPGDQA